MKKTTKKSPNRDALDFAHEPVGRLFRQMFFPTLLGLVSMVVLNITDGAFVGRGVGSDALAAVNIVAPLFMLSGGVGLMLGIGCSVVASIHLSHNNRHAADLNLTQGILASVMTGIIMGALVYSGQERVCRIFGCTDRLMPLACSYLRWIAVFMPLNMFGTTAMFMVRLDGSPRFAMAINCTAAALNIFLDWLFVFPLHFGLQGAAMATVISFGLCTLPVCFYVTRLSHSVRLCRIKLSATSRRLTRRNLGYQCRVGFSALLGELAIASVLVVGNHTFMNRMGEDGVAAYSVACYCLPIAFMMGNAITQSVQPIVSIAYGRGDQIRMHSATRIAVFTAVFTGLLGMLFIGTGGSIVSSTFLPVSTYAFTLCCHGLPLFSLAFLFITINIALIGYMQSTEQSSAATLFTILRGFVICIPCFIVLPMLAGNDGLWLALPLAEALTTISIAVAWRTGMIRTKADHIL
ncbi:MAG: MATE family efflux transporter [Bacteroidaceae bacterium]